MRLNVKVKKTRSYNQKIAKLKKQLKALHNSSVFIGYYNDQGEHEDSGLTYVELMTIHEFGAPDVNIPARPVLKLTENGGFFSEQDKIAIGNAFKGVFVKNIPISQPLNDIGQYYEDKGKAIFGQSPPLLNTVEGNPPLIDTGDLQSKFSYRTSLTYKSQ